MTIYLCTSCGEARPESELRSSAVEAIRIGRCRSEKAERYWKRRPEEPSTARAHARATDPETSRDAAASISSERIRESQSVLLALLRRLRPSTDAEIYQAIESDIRLRALFSESGARTRRSELVSAGLVEDSGERRKLPSGRFAIVWRLRK